MRSAPSAIVTDPLHVPCEAPVRWSRGNLAEFLPGVVTPFTWDFWRSNEAASQRIYYRLGLANAAELAVPTLPEHRMTNIFHGWPFANVDALRGMIDRAPGAPGDSFERQLLGEADLPAPSGRARQRKRPLMVMAKSALWTLTFPGELRAQVARTDAWWRGIVAAAADASLSHCHALLDDCYARNESVSVQAGFGLFAGQMLFGRLEALLPIAHRHLLLTLVSGGAQLRELKVLEEMWTAARSGSEPAPLIAAHGFYGVSAGECMNRSWREDAAPVLEAIEAYRGLGEDQAPAVRLAARRRAVDEGVARIVALLPAAKARRVRRLIARLERLTVWREEGKACALQAIDGARAVVRRMGALLAGAGALAGADDAFFFTRAELRRAPWPGMRETACWRRARRAYYQRLEIPDAFIGSPIVSTKGDAAQAPAPVLVAGETLGGVGVSPGVVEGVARVIADPRMAGAFQAGDILVCSVTDPSWAPLFLRAGGIVTDIGGMLSHGAVIARELGVPCVVNTRGGTRRIPDGAGIRIDGATGEIRLLDDFQTEAVHAL